MADDFIVVEVNGREADQAALALLEHEGWGHFTAMQVRGGRTRGLDLHLARLEAAHREIYGQALDGAEVCDRIRHALGVRPDASVRVYGYWAGLIVTVRETQEMPDRPHSMATVYFQVGTFTFVVHAADPNGGLSSNQAYSITAADLACSADSNGGSATGGVCVLPAAAVGQQYAAAFAYASGTGGSFSVTGTLPPDCPRQRRWWQAAPPSKGPLPSP